MVLLWGLIIGYLFTKFSRTMANGAWNTMINHLKGLAVIIAACGLFAILLLNPGGGWAKVGLFLAATISFYFGSKT